jgi:hypothetical protein
MHLDDVFSREVAQEKGDDPLGENAVVHQGKCFNSVPTPVSPQSGRAARVQESA